MQKRERDYFNRGEKPKYVKGLRRYKFSRNKFRNLMKLLREPIPPKINYGWASTESEGYTFHYKPDILKP